MNTSNNVHTFGLVRVHYKQCDSTQTRMQQIVSKTSPKEGLIISSDYQSAGRGQLDSRWSAKPNLNIAFSMLFKPVQLSVEYQYFFNIWSSLAIIQELERKLNGAEVKVKWPNDIMINDRKAGGILIQSSLRSNAISHIILGVGLNVNECMENYPFPATSLRDIGKMCFDVKELQEIMISAILHQCEKGLQSSNFKEGQKAFENKLWKRDKTVVISEKGKLKNCLIMGIQSSGELKVQIDGEERSLRHKEVEFMIK